MVIEILSYKASILNPLFKCLIVILYAIGTWFFYRAWRKYEGNLKVIAGVLMCGGIAACIGAGARFLGDYLVQFKWMESSGAIIFAFVSLFVAWLVYRKFSDIAVAFGLKEEGE